KVTWVVVHVVHEVVTGSYRCTTLMDPTLSCRPATRPWRTTTRDLVSCAVNSFQVTARWMTGSPRLFSSRRKAEGPTSTPSPNRAGLFPAPGRCGGHCVAEAPGLPRQTSARPG